MVVSQKIKHRITMTSSKSISQYMPKRFESRDSHRYLYANVRGALFSITKRWKQLKCPSVDEGRNKLCYMHITDYC